MDGNVNLLGGGGGAGRKPLKSGMKELAVFREKVTEQHRQMGKGGKHHLGLEEPKKLRPPPARVREGRVWLEGWEDSQRECPVRSMSSVPAGKVLSDSAANIQCFFRHISISLRSSASLAVKWAGHMGS